MSNYTMQLRFLCEKEAGLSSSVGLNNVELVIENSRERIFNNGYPIFDENYRSTLEHSILSYYYTREIGFEAPSLFIMKLRQRMSIIMPKYNLVYKKILDSDNILYNTSLKKTGGKTRTESTDSSRDMTAVNSLKDSNSSLFSDTPQGSIDDLKAGKYLSSVTISDGTTTSEGDTTDKYTEDRLTVDDDNTVVLGWQGKGFYELYSDYLEKFQNVDMSVILELSDLFISIY